MVLAVVALVQYVLGTLVVRLSTFKLVSCHNSVIPKSNLKLYFNNYSKSYTAGAVRGYYPFYYIMMCSPGSVHLVQWEVLVLTRATRLQEVVHI